MSIGKGKSSESSQGQVWGEQSPFLQSLYQGAQDQMGGVMQQNQQIQGQAQQAFGNIVNPQGNPYLKQMGQQGLDLLNQNFGENLNQIQGSSVAAGSLGGSRQGVAQGMAMQQNQQQQSDFINQLYGSQYQSDMNRAAGALPMANQLGSGGLAPFQSLAGIYGGPTVLNQSQGRESQFKFGL